MHRLFEMVVNCLIAAGKHFFGLKELSSEPKANVIALDAKDSDLKRRWKVLSHVVGRLVDRYVIVHKHADIQPNAPAQSPVTAKSVEANPHAIRIQDEHNYSSSLVTQIAAEHCYVDSVPEKRKKRHLPPWLCGVPMADATVQEKAPDVILNYACAILSDGLLMLNF